MRLVIHVSLLTTSLLGSTGLIAQVPDHITPVGRARNPRLGLEVAVGELRLPARMKGASLRLAAGETSLARPLMVAPPSLYARERELALQRVQADDHSEEAYRFVSAHGLYRAFETYAAAHGGRGPASLEDPAFQRLLKPEHRKALEGHALVPNVNLAETSAILLVELAPRFDDGLHWVFTTQLEGQRRPVDAALMKRVGKPLQRDRIVKLPPPPPGPEDLVPFQVLGLRRGESTSAKLELWHDGRNLGALTFTFSTKETENLEPLSTWLRARCVGWSIDAPLSEGLWAAAESAYTGDGLRLGVSRNQLREARNRGRESRMEEASGPSMLALLGGRAAVDETLQLDRDLEAKAAGAAIPFAQIPGIDTPPHPWAEMRKGRPAPTRLPLADCVPLDRALVYLQRPADALASMEGGGAAFLSRVNSFLGETRLDTSIVERILADLGLGSGLGRRLIAAGGVKEMVFFCSDLAFLSGTEVTVVAELSPLVGALVPLPQEGIQARGPAFWARRGNRLFISTSRQELERSLKLQDAQGAGSLGRSDEFAVVLGELAPDAATEGYAYLSDGFIRHLLNPRQRILQMRQAQARGRMEDLAAAALLRRLDAPGEAVDVDRLKALGYLHEGLDLEGLRLASDGRVSHRDFGFLDHLTPLERLPLEAASDAEAAAYANFKAAYSQYWRRYFDPIAFRLDGGEGGRMSLETFVLPLLDTSIYNAMKAAVASGDRPRPKWALPMVAELGLHVSPHTLDRGGPISRTLSMEGLDFSETFTGTVALGFPDGAPVVQAGSGSLATLFDSGLFARRSDIMALGAVALGTFTRPLVVALELKQPEVIASELRNLGWDGLPLPRFFKEFEGRITREPDGRLLVRVGFFGLASMRFTARVEDRWLVLSNDASLPSPLVAGSDTPSAFPFALRLQPGALKLGLPSAFQAAMEGEAKAAWGAMAWLAPWLQSGVTPEAARAESHRLIGIAPLLASEDLEAPGSSLHRRFGTTRWPRTPAFDPSGHFGMFEGVNTADVELRFEGTGMRARVSWTR